MHLAFIVLYGVVDDFTYGCFDFFYFVVTTTLFFLDLLDFMLVCNFFFMIRLRGFAILDCYDIFFNSISGVLSRSCGLV